MKSHLPLYAVFVLLLLFRCDAFSAEITAERSEKGAVVKIDGQLFTEYLVRSGSKPILWPIIGPTGKPMTRDYPLLDHPGEKNDHPHQRSLWFTHGEVNGIDFWDEDGQQGGHDRSTSKFLEVAGGKPAVIATRNAWLAPDGKKVCEDQRTLRFDTDGDARWIDFDITIKATDGAGDFRRHEGRHVRRARGRDHQRRRQSGRQDRQQPAAGRRGRLGAGAAWVDYHGPSTARPWASPSSIIPAVFVSPRTGTCGPTAVCGQSVRVARFCGRRKPASGAYTLSPGESVTFRYRVLLHRGDEKEGKVAEAFVAYAKEIR